MPDWEPQRLEAKETAEHTQKVCNKRFFRKHILQPLVPTRRFPSGNHAVSARNAVYMAHAYKLIQIVIADWPVSLRERYTGDALEWHPLLMRLEQEYAELHRKILLCDAKGHMLEVVVYTAARADMLVREMHQKVKWLDLWKDEDPI